MVDEQGEARPTKVLAKGDYRFLCVACHGDLIVQAAGTFAVANRLIGAIGWRVFLRDDRGGATGLHCAKCSQGRQAVLEPPAEAA